MKKLLVSVLIVFAIMVQPFAAAASNEPVIDTSRIDEGVISVSHTAGQRLKVIVARGDKEVIYDLRNDGIAETYPLQLGNGEYTVSVLENTTGNKYRYIKKQTVRLELEDEKQVFLASVQNINWRYDMKAIQKAKELTAGLKSDSDKIKKIYDYIVNSFTYDYDVLASLPTGYVPDIDNTLESGKGICYDFSSVFAAMLRSQGIPVKLVKGYTTNVEGYHAWNEVYNSETGEWIVVDTTYDVVIKAAGRAVSMAKETAHYSKVYEY
jgi:transglutaminase-like putative cysteine protease